MNPLTGLYAGIIGLRNALFDHRVLKEERLERPVVSVGNLSVGGAGKTPFVIALGELLKARGIGFDILSRGYRRKTRGALRVETDGTAADFGDEPLLIARRLGVPVFVGESRYEAGRLAEKQSDGVVHILDDGFQHRSLARQFDIVLVSESDFSDKLLPAGRLREPISALARANAIILPSGFEPGGELPSKPIWRIQRELAIVDTPASPIAFCGLARPQQFFDQLRSAGITAAAEVRFRDHHAYAKRDIDRLLRQQKEVSAGGFVTTEKDAVNLGPWREKLGQVAVMRLNVVIEQADVLADTILDRIRNLERRT